MGRITSLLKLFARMTAYGTVLGAIAGALVGITLLMTMWFSPYGADSLLSNIVGSFVMGSIYGALFGGVYGGVAGFVSGAGMAFVTAIGFGIIRNPQNYKRVMGGITAIMTGFIFFGFGLLDFGGGGDMTWLFIILISIAIAVYASQRAARLYVNDMSVRKEKVKAQ